MLKVVGMSPRKMRRSIKAKNHIDVRKKEDVDTLKDIMKNNKLTAVLIYADYCGHCHRYMDEIWNGLALDQKRKNGMASIHYDQLENTPLAGTTVSGYPTVLVLGEDSTPISFKNEQTGQNENDYPDSRNREKMAEILNSEPETAMKSFKIQPISNLNDTLNLSEESRDKRLSSEMSDADRVIDRIEHEKPTLKPKKMASVPDYTDDMLNSQDKNIDSGGVAFKKKVARGGSTSNNKEDVISGGSLYKVLMGGISSSKKTARKRKGDRQSAKKRRT
jgi:hypothetical protein